MEILMSSELDLFSTEKFATNILKSEEIFFKPSTSLDQNHIEFCCSSVNDRYIDLASNKLKIIGHFVNPTDEDEIKSDEIGYENPLLHALIKQVSISLNGKVVSANDNCYPYRAMIETLMNFDPASEKSQLKCVGWYDTDGGSPDEFLKSSNFEKIAAQVKKGTSIELIGKLHIDMANQNLLLISNVDTKIMISLNSPEFYMLSGKTKDKTYFKITDARLYFRSAIINPKIVLTHQLILESRLACYYYKRVEIRQFTVSAGTNSINLNNVCNGELPSSVIFTMVDNDAFVGKRTKSGFNFKHNNISHIVLNVNSSQIPLDGIEMDFKNKVSSRAYSTLFSANGTFYSHVSNLISREMYENGHFFIAFDLENYQVNGFNSSSIPSQGTLGLQARFDETLSSSITCLCYLQFNTCLKIDKNRNILLN
jgi:hypothetical protein